MSTKVLRVSSWIPAVALFLSFTTTALASSGQALMTSAPQSPAPQYFLGDTNSPPGPNLSMIPGVGIYKWELPNGSQLIQMTSLKSGRLIGVVVKHADGKAVQYVTEGSGAQCPCHTTTTPLPGGGEIISYFSLSSGALVKQVIVCGIGFHCTVKQ